MTGQDTTAAAPVPTFRETVKVFARIGCLSFGGPAGQIALMHRVAVDEKRWISEERFLHALNYCMLLPGPEAQQLATYIGWLMHGTRGGVAAGLLFVLPGFLVILCLSSLYALFHQTAWLASLFFGLKAAVLAVVLEALIRLGRRALKTPFHAAVAALSFLALFLFDLPFPLVVLAAGLAGLAFAPDAAPAATPSTPGVSPRDPGQGAGRFFVRLALWVAVWQAPLLLLLLLPGEGGGVLSALFRFFSYMAVVTFGGAYAVLSYVAQVAVDQYGWLRPGEMLDGLALAETTPGPLVLVLSFVGFLAGFRAYPETALLGGILGATLSAWATFVPSFLWIFAGAPYIERLRHNRRLARALSAITAAVVGVILNLALWFALHVFFGAVERLALAGGVVSLAWPQWRSLDLAALAIFLLATVALFRFKLGMVPVLALAGLAGFALRQI